MSHRSIADVWAVLQGRVDIDNIVNELIGTHALQKLDNARFDPVKLRNVGVDLTVALKAIFDLQRTYLQTSRPSFESKTSLLSPNILRHALVYLIDVKTTTFALHNELMTHKDDCDLLAHTFLSGLRALLLRRPSLSVQEHKRLTISFREAWAEEDLDETCHFVVHFLCGQIITQLGLPLQENPCALPAFGLVELQDYFSGLYPVQRQANSLCYAAQQVANGTDWFKKSLVFYDLCWSTTAALIQLCTDIQSKTTMHSWTRTDEVVRNSDLNEILTSRFRLLEQIYVRSLGGVSGEDIWCNDQIRGALVHGMRPECMESQCDCSNYQAPSTISPLLSQDEKSLLEAIKRHLRPLQQFDGVEQAHKTFVCMLEDRASALLDCNGELGSLAETLKQSLHDWCPRSSTIGQDMDAKKSLPTEEFYITSCSELHPIPAKELFESNNQAYPVNRLGHRELPSLIPPISNIRCHQCTWDSQMVSARKIEPLSKLSTQLQNRLQIWHKIAEAKIGLNALPSERVLFPRRSKRWITEPPPVPSVPSSPPPPFSPLHSNSATESASGSSNHYLTASTSMEFPNNNQSQTTVSRAASTQRPIPVPLPPASPDLPEVVTQATAQSYDAFSMSSGHTSHGIVSPHSAHGKRFGGFSSIFKSDKAAASIPSALFFASGRRMVLYNDKGAGYYDFEDPEDVRFMPWTTAGNVLLAAGGTDSCAVISRTNTNHTLSIFKANQAPPAHVYSIETAPHTLAVSRNDKFVALKFSKAVLIYEIPSGETIKHDLPSMKAKAGKGNHLVTFSNDSTSFVASTRYEPERVVTHWSLCKTPSSQNRVESKAPFGHVNDGGLSSLLCTDTQKQMAFLSTFTEKGFPVFLRLSDPSSPQSVPDNTGKIGSRIHRTAICPDGSSIAFLTQGNELYWMTNAFGRGSLPQRITRVKRRNSVAREVELGMPRRDEVLLFWIDKEKARGTLVTVGKSGGKADPVHLGVDMNVLLQ